ncbi:MAG TPA: AI-2E family transporter [Longimicrobiaceae bacterium]|nr:AI-2E family transporter [Longimicrobiaceae bacterium]
MIDSVVRRITWRTSDVARILVLTVVFLFLWKFFWMVYSALFLGLIAVLIAIVLHAPSRFLSRWIPFRIAFVLVVLAFLAALAGLLIRLIPQVVHQMSLLAVQLPAALGDATAWVRQHTGVAASGQLLANVNRQVGEFVGRFVPLAFNIITVVVGAFAIITLAVFLAAQPDLYRNLFFRLIPPPGRERARRIYDEAGHSLRNWVLGKLLTMALTGTFIYLGLSLFEVPGALALASFSAVMEFIPNFGPTIAAVPAIVSAFLISPSTALYVTIYYVVFQQVQAAVTVPLVERRAVDIPPAALLLWQLMLAVGFGILGLFVATPLLAVIVVVVRILYVEPTEERYDWDRREAMTPPVEGG